MSSSPNRLWQQHTVSVIFRACLKSHLLTSVYWSRGHQQSMTALWDNHCCKGCEVIEKRVGPLRHSVSFSGAEANQLTGSYSWLKTSWNSETWNTLKKKNDRSQLCQTPRLSSPICWNRFFKALHSDLVPQCKVHQTYSSSFIWALIVEITSEKLELTIYELLPSSYFLLITLLLIN